MTVAQPIFTRTRLGSRITGNLPILMSRTGTSLDNWRSQAYTIQLGVGADVDVPPR